MIRKIIEINGGKCNGCGLCAKACHENAIGMVNGKAKLLRDDYCDGLGDCLPTCPTGAITFVEREAAAYDEAAVEENKRKNQGKITETTNRNKTEEAERAKIKAKIGKMNRQWPIQIQLTPVNAPYFDNADLLIAADCTAFAYSGFANEIQKGKVTLIGCPKLDPVDYSEKLTAIIEQNDIKSVTIARMEVPCCGGIQNAAVRAMKKSGKFIPWQVITVSVEGEIL